MLTTLRAFAWMRWRILVNSLELTGARDTVERFSIAVEQIGPMIAAVLFVPSAVALAALAGYAGHAAASSSGTAAIVEVVRYLLLVALALCVVGPILLPVSERTNPVRLLLLPISRHTLYAAQAFSAIADPWIVLTLPVVIALPIGLALGGAVAASAVAGLSGVILIAAFIGLSALTTTVLHLIVRDRRRGELLALLFIVILPLALMIPGVMETRERGIDPETGVRRTRIPAWAWNAGTAVFSALPSERFVSAVRRSLTGGAASAGVPVAALATMALVLHGVGLAAFGRALDSRGTSRSRSPGASRAGQSLAMPGISAGASAVALNQIRLALRTPRGRSTLLSPFVVFVMFAILMRQSSGAAELGFIELGSGLALATFAAAVCLLATLPFAMNQFAMDRTGLTLQLLSPLSDLDILIGKAAGNGVIAGVPALICMAVAFALFPSGPTALWLCVPLGLLGTYLLGAPAAAALSAVFPRAVDLNSIGRGSNAHGAAGVLGMLAFAAAAAPPALLALLATAGFGRAALAPLFLLLWAGVALAIARVLFAGAARLFHRRRENLAMVA